MRRPGCFRRRVCPCGCSRGCRCLRRRCRRGAGRGVRAVRDWISATRAGWPTVYCAIERGQREIRVKAGRAVTPAMSRRSSTTAAMTASSDSERMAASSIPPRKQRATMVPSGTRCENLVPIQVQATRRRRSFLGTRKPNPDGRLREIGGVDSPWPRSWTSCRARRPEARRDGNRGRPAGERRYGLRRLPLRGGLRSIRRRPGRGIRGRCVPQFRRAPAGPRRGPRRPWRRRPPCRPVRLSRCGRGERARCWNGPWRVRPARRA